ncbi:Fic family protein [Schleiferilactobacillus perolens]|uniref:Fido domain-containing protein n=1 Tax=Schleiferilactobacillus perolens DSM 12744 TaxID=1423792 RepID=A0A0R1N2C4_9LACO|nr:Fic family protein [Schleiferilactobacillus perolens]KRL11682.1 hypothetical protein FD09_GL000605 [Schleiferilactobacillus perolens DSM 12744]
MFEHLTLQYSEVESILKDQYVPDIKPSEIQVILNLRDAYQYAATINNVTDFSLTNVLEINLLVKGARAQDAGQIRTTDVIVPLTNETYQPPIPNEAQVQKLVTNIMSDTTTTTDKALTLMLTLSRMQPFMDGNKRTAIVAASALMFADKRGLIAIPEDKLHWYSWQLTKYYRSDNMQPLKQWLADNAVFGINA